MGVGTAIKSTSLSNESSGAHEVYLPEKSLRDWGIAALLFVLSILYLWPFHNFSRLDPDEGIILQGAQRILSGQVLYGDFFSFYTPASYYWLALRFWIFGDSFFAARGVLLLYGGTFSLVTYMLARRVCTRWTAVLTAYLLLILSLPYRFLTLHNWDSILSGFLALYCAVRLLEAPHWFWAFGTGTLASLTFLFEQSKGTGLILGLALGFFLIALHQPDRPFLSRSCSAAMLGGLAWPVAITLGYFAWQGSLIAMFTDWFWPLQHYSGANRLPYGYINIPFEAWEELYGGGLVHRLLAILLTSPFFIMPGLPFLALGLVIFHTHRMRREGRVNPGARYYTIICATSLGLVLSALATGRPEYDHILYVGPPLFLLLGWILGGRPVPSQLLTKLQPLLVTYVLITFTAFGMTLLIGGPFHGQQELQTRRGVLRVPDPDKVVPFVVGQVPAGETMFVYPYQPMYYFLTRTFSPTSFDYLQLGMHPPAQMNQAMDDLAADRTEVVVYAPSFNSETVPQSWPATSQHVLATDRVRDFIFSHYRPCTPLESFHWRYVYMVRRDLRCPGETPSP
jgi:4-amino-4-deoxy-L-arabinose transferase-like glycosyltransferase